MLEMFMGLGGCAGPIGSSVTYCIMKKNYSIIAKEMIPKQRNILVETFDKNGNIIETKMDSALETERITSTQITKLLKEDVEQLDFRLENLLSNSTLKLIPCLPNMKRYWLEKDGFVRGEKKYEIVEPPAKICFMISKSLIEVCVGERPKKTYFDKLKKDLETNMDVPNKGQIIQTTSENVCVLMSNKYYTKYYLKDCQKTTQDITMLTQKILKNYPQLNLGKYSTDKPKIYYRYPPGTYEDEEAKICEPKDQSYNVSFRFGFWQAWFEIIIAIDKLAENDYLDNFTLNLRNKLYDFFNSLINPRS
jgi:hypothetical protein